MKCTVCDSYRLLLFQKKLEQGDTHRGANSQPHVCMVCLWGGGGGEGNKHESQRAFRMK